MLVQAFGVYEGKPTCVGIHGAAWATHICSGAHLWTTERQGITYGMLLLEAYRAHEGILPLLRSEEKKEPRRVTTKDLPATYRIVSRLRVLHPPDDQLYSAQVEARRNDCMDKGAQRSCTYAKSDGPQQSRNGGTATEPAVRVRSDHE